MTLFVGVMLPVVIALGLWQLERAAEKRGYEDQFFDRIGALPQPPGAEAPAAFQRLRLDGEYLPGRYFLVDNRIQAGRPGYWVVSLFRTRDERTWLVNRGWIAGGDARERLPAVSTPPGSVAIVAVAWPDTGMVPLLADDVWREGWPKRVQRLDVARMAGLAGAVPVELRLEAGEPGAFVAASQDVDFSPRQHQGYAVQWFGLGIALLLGYLLFGYRPHD